MKGQGKASIGVHYLRPVKKPTLSLDHIPPWFERMKEDLQRDRCSLTKPLSSRIKLATQRPARYDEQLLRSRDFKRDLTTLLPMGKEMLQKTRITLFIDSTMKATANMNYTLMDMQVMDLPCSSLEEMAEMTCKVFGQRSDDRRGSGVRRSDEKCDWASSEKKTYGRRNLRVAPWVHTLAGATPTIAVLAIRSRSRTEPAFLHRSPESKGQRHDLASMRDLILCIPG